MNLLMDIGIYGTLCKELGLEFRWATLGCRQCCQGCSPQLCAHAPSAAADECREPACVLPA
jgi:hypothetical protein